MFKEQEQAEKKIAEEASWICDHLERKYEGFEKEEATTIVLGALAVVLVKKIRDLVEKQDQILVANKVGSFLIRKIVRPD